MTKPAPVMLSVRCPVCRQCWVEAGSYICIYNGPFHGYVEVRSGKPKDAH